MAHNIKSLLLVGLGLIGSSLARACRHHYAGMTLHGYDANPEICKRAEALGLCDKIHRTANESMEVCDAIILCIPVSTYEVAMGNLAQYIRPGILLSDTGSTKRHIFTRLQKSLPSSSGVHIIPAHPVAGTEESGPEAGLATLFAGRHTILTPPDEASPEVVLRLQNFWEGLGSQVEIMDPAHHDHILGATSHLPHLVAWALVGTVIRMEKDFKTDSREKNSEIIRYSAGGFRDFTRIAASDPAMWRDIFTANGDEILTLLDSFSGEIASLRDMIADQKGKLLYDYLEKTRSVRDYIVAEKQAGQFIATEDLPHKKQVKKQAKE